MAYLIGIDIGTSGTKTAIFDHGGALICASTKEYALSQPQNGWAEQNPEDFWDAIVAGLQECFQKSGVAASDIDGIGLSGQMHGLVMLDKDNRVLRPCIIWCDQRTAKECEEITAKVGAERLIEITANPALTGFTASKILWVKNNQPEIYEKCAKILLPKDYIRFKLTGEFATEVSDASGMQLLDVPKRAWSDEVLSKLDIDKALLARVYESYEVSGQVTASAANETGLKAGTSVVGGAGDQAAGAVGSGIVKDGIISSTIGTSGVVFAHTDKISIDKGGRVHTFCHAVPGAWHVMGVTQAAGLSLQWLRNQMCTAEMEEAKKRGIDPYIIMDDMAAQVPIGANRLLYLPYLMGERTPHLDADCRGVFFGLSAMHTRADMIRSVMEGVSYSLNDCLQIIKNMGITPGAIRASGGGGKSPLWRQMQADVFNTPVQVNQSAEGGALGVALLAGVGVGVYKSVPEACEATIHIKEETAPVAGNSEKYAKVYALYTKLYPSLKGHFSELAGL